MIHLCSRRRFISLLALVALPPVAMAQVPRCTLRPKGDDIGYKLRDKNRCEGEYISEVAGTELSLASFTRVFVDFDPKKVAALRVAWNAPGDSSVTLQVRSVTSGRYYGMDARWPRTTREFQWPTAILDRTELRQADLGALAWTSMLVRNKALKVYVPLEITGRPGATSSSGYEVKVFPSVRLRELYYTLSQVDSTGRVLRLVVKDAAVEAGPYVAKEAITVTIPNPGPKGLYRIEFKANTAPVDRVITIDPAYFFHSGS